METVLVVGLCYLAILFRPTMVGLVAVALGGIALLRQPVADR